MLDNQKIDFKIKDIIIDQNQTYKIFKITKKKPQLIFFKSHPAPKNDNNLISSIPMDNIDKTSIRKPIGKKDIKKLFKKLSLNIYPQRKSRAINNRVKTDLLLSNDPFDVIKLIRVILIRKRDENINFSLSNKKDFQTCIQNFLTSALFL